MNLENELKIIDDSISEQVLDLYKDDVFYSGTYISMFRFEQYDRLVTKLNKIRYKCQSYDDKQNLLPQYRKIYYAQKNKYANLLKNLENNKLKIEYNKELEYYSDYLKKLISVIWRYEDDKSIEDNIKLFMLAKFKQLIYEINNEIYKIKFFPYEYINTFDTFIGPYNPMKFEKDIVFYKDVFIAHKEMHHFSVFYNEHSTEETKLAILNVLAFLNGEPFFYFTENHSFNRKLDDLYRQFDLMDMLRLRNKDYLDSKRQKPFHIECPILKNKPEHSLIEIKPISHEMMFELYHASLKQFEPLPRCVFLYRVFEYGANKHYIPYFRPTNYSPQDALNYYVNEIMEHRFIPLYYVDFGTYISDDKNEIIRKRKVAYRNFFINLRDEVKKIIKEWSVHPYLRNKSVGEIIYNTGRNASAHGAGGQLTARYDYDKNYKHINDINIFLELISRYLIEVMNPDIVKMVECKRKHYIIYNNYEKIFSEKRDSMGEVLLGKN